MMVSDIEFNYPYVTMRATTRLVPCEWFVTWMPTTNWSCAPKAGFDIAWFAGRSFA